MVILSKKENGRTMVHIDCMDAMLFGAVFTCLGMLYYSGEWFSNFSLRSLFLINLLMVFRSFHRWIDFVRLGIKGGK